MTEAKRVYANYLSEKIEKLECELRYARQVGEFESNLERRITDIKMLNKEFESL